jgi:hypothetical protein
MTPTPRKTARFWRNHAPTVVSDSRPPISIHLTGARCVAETRGLSAIRLSGEREIVGCSTVRGGTDCWLSPCRVVSWETSSPVDLPGAMSERTSVPGFQVALARTTPRTPTTIIQRWPNRCPANGVLPRVDGVCDVRPDHTGCGGSATTIHGAPTGPPRGVSQRQIHPQCTIWVLFLDE